MNWRGHKKLLMKDAEFKAEYDALDLKCALARELIRLKLSQGLTKKLASWTSTLLLPSQGRTSSLSPLRMNAAFDRSGKLPPNRGRLASGII